MFNLPGMGMARAAHRHDDEDGDAAARVNTIMDRLAARSRGAGPSGARSKYMQDFIRGAFAGSALEASSDPDPAEQEQDEKQGEPMHSKGTKEIQEMDEQFLSRGWYVPQESVVEHKASSASFDETLPEEPVARAAAIARRIAERTNADGLAGPFPGKWGSAPSPDTYWGNFDDSKNASEPSRKMQRSDPDSRRFQGDPPEVPQSASASKEPVKEAGFVPAPLPEEPKKKVSMVLNNVLGKFQAAAAASIEARQLQPKAAPIGSITIRKPEDDDYLDEPANIGAAHAGGRGAASSVAEEGAGRHRSFKERSRSRRAAESRRKRDSAFGSESPDRQALVKKPPPKARSPSRRRGRKSIFGDTEAASAARPQPGGVQSTPITQYFGVDDVPLPPELTGRLLGTRGMNMRRIEAHLGGQVHIQILNAPTNVKGAMQKLQVQGARKLECITILKGLVAELNKNPNWPITASAVWQQHMGVG